MEDVRELDADCTSAIEGMAFFGEPVQDMNSESLLRVIGYLVIQNEQLKSDAYRSAWWSLMAPILGKTKKGEA